MGDTSITGSQWKNVEVGRVVYIRPGSGHKYEGKIATIVEIVDHKRALIDGPSSKEGAAVPRQVIALDHCLMTSIVIGSLPRGARYGTVKAAWEKEKVDSLWQDGSWAKSAARSQKRRSLTDFDRFKVMRLRKQARFAERRAFKAKA